MPYSNHSFLIFFCVLCLFLSLLCVHASSWNVCIFQQCACMCRPQVDTGMSFPIMLHLIFLTQSGAHINWLGQPASKLPSIGITAHITSLDVFLGAGGPHDCVAISAACQLSQSLTEAVRTKTVGWKTEPSVRSLGPRLFLRLSIYTVLLPVCPLVCHPAVEWGWLMIPKAPCSRVMQCCKTYPLGLELA